MTDTFITEDMTLVAVLKTRGIEYSKMENNYGGCRWLFPNSRVVQDIVEEYNNEEAYCEPREFAKKLGLVRSEMYRFLGVQPRKVRG